MQLGPKTRLFSNIAGFQISWLACVIGGSLPALPVVGLFALWHSKMSWDKEWRVIALFCIVGVCMDSVFTLLGFLSFEASGFPYIPIWLTLLWLAFAMTLLHSMSFVLERVWLSCLLAAIAAPFSYFTGEKLGALTVAENGYLCISIGWLLLLGSTSLLVNRYGLITK